MGGKGANGRGAGGLACETQHMCSEKRKSNQEAVEEEGKGAREGRARGA